MERGSLIVRINRYSYCMMEGKPINPAIDLRKEVTSIDQINVILILYRVRLNMSMRSDGVLRDPLHTADGTCTARLLRRCRSR